MYLLDTHVISELRKAKFSTHDFVAVNSATVIIWGQVMPESNKSLSPVRMQSTCAAIAAL